MGGTPTTDDPGVAFTLFDGDKLLGCGGLVPMGDTVGAWLELSDEIRARPVTLHRLIRRILAVQKATWPMPIVAVVRSDFATARKWIERLGFEENGRTDELIRYELRGT